MPPLLAIIADDLTGALDCAAPFAARGRRTVAALRPEALAEALNTAPEILAVTTASRHLDEAAAARIAGDVATACLEAGVRCLLKKVDSRLQGHVGAETLAVSRILGAGRIVIAPAVPSQGRSVTAGRIRGRGVAETGIAVRERFAATEGLTLEIPDCRDADDLAAIAGAWLARADDTLLVGAHGIATALADRLGPARPASAAFRADPPVLLVIGSQDAITSAQVAALMAARLDCLLVDAPGGALPAPPTSRSSTPPLTLLRSVPGPAPSANMADPLASFAEGAAPWLQALRPRTLLVTGGETAAGLLARIGCEHLALGGEAALGLPWSRTASGLLVVTKSGGFGGPEQLAALVGRAGEGVA